VERKTFQLTFVTLDNSCPADVRLRRLLKTALRAYRLRCVEVREMVLDETIGMRSLVDQSQEVRKR
jgi:hypothetical protein